MQLKQGLFTGDPQTPPQHGQGFAEIGWGQERRVGKIHIFGGTNL